MIVKNLIQSFPIKMHKKLHFEINLHTSLNNNYHFNHSRITCKQPQFSNSELTTDTAKEATRKRKKLTR